jgi:Fe-S cluster assembly iron-binding protein IscA
MSKTMNFLMTDAALENLRILLAEEGNSALKLRINLDENNAWMFTFDEVVADDDIQIDFGAVSVVLASNIVDSLREASVDFDSDAGFNIRNATPPENHLEKVNSLWEAALDEVNDASECSPRDYPYCVYLQDEWVGASGYVWFKNEMDLRNALVRILLGFMSQLDEINLDANRTNLEKIINGGDESYFRHGMRESLEVYLIQSNSPLRCSYIGSFEALCNSKDKWSCEVRSNFRTKIADYDEIENMSEDELESPIGANEIQEFSEFHELNGIS